MSRRRRAVLFGLIALGIALILAPAVFGMFTRAPKGATMLEEFEPFMRDPRLTRFEGYLDEIDQAVEEVDTEVQPFLEQRIGMDRQQFEATFPAYASFEREWQQIDRDMSDLVGDVHDNLGNYEAVDALPPFTLFPWFFVVPGVLLTAIGTVALFRPARVIPTLTAAMVLGLGLVAAPFAFHMLHRAPKGAEMMDEFRPIMIRSRVHTIQGYFGTMSVGQGALRIDILPAVERAAGGEAEVANRFPAAVALDEGWIGILNDMTPMIGAMSDNVDNYQAVDALPPFTLFPWFFIAPGALIVVLAVVALRARGPAAPGRRETHRVAVSAPTEEEQPAMTHRFQHRALVTFLTVGVVATAFGGMAVAGASAPERSKPKPLVGTFALNPGVCDESGQASGTYVRMIFPDGDLEEGPFFENPDSTCSDKSYTLAEPGTDGGLVTGRYQRQPNPPFDDSGNALADGIITPQPFTAIRFSVSTNSTEPQTGTDVPKPAIRVSKGKLTGDLRALTASWNEQHFSQGSPKPDGSTPGLTKRISGRYDPETREFVLKWASQIVGGPFNDFTGFWHLEGVFEPKKK
jgi:hypothetical protein